VKIAPPSARSMRRPVPLAQRKLRPGLPRTVVRGRPAVPVKPEREPAKAVAATPAPAIRPANGLALRGQFWEITYEGRTAIVEDCRGLRYIALLIRDGRPTSGPIHAKELVALTTGQSGVTELERKDELLDSVAKRQLLDTLREIGEARDRACAAEDFDRAEALDGEYERIANELSRAQAPVKGGRRGAAFTDAGEKARKAVGKAISEAIARIASHPELAALAEHLSSTIRKGQWLSYGGNLHWSIDLRPSLPRG
jgi:hypothetical protein